MKKDKKLINIAEEIQRINQTNFCISNIQIENFFWIWKMVLLIMKNGVCAIGV